MTLWSETTKLPFRGWGHDLFAGGNFLKFDVVAQFVLLVGTGLSGLLGIGLLLLHVLVHALLHFAEPLFYLAGGAVQRDDELKNKLVQDIC